MIFWPIFIKNFIAIDSNGITLNLARSLFSKSLFLKTAVNVFVLRKELKQIDQR